MLHASPPSLRANAVTLSLLAAAAAHAQNVLLNAGFEEGTLNHWESYAAPTPQETSALFTTPAPHSGNFAALTNNTTYPFYASIVQRFAGIDSAAIANMSFWYLVPASQPAPDLSVFIERTIGPSYGGVPVTADGLWHHVQFGSPGVGTTIVGFGILTRAASPTGANIIQFDDFSVTRLPAPGAAALLGLASITVARRRSR